MEEPVDVERDRLLSFLVGWLLFTATLPTLIIYRAILQPRYQWGLFGILGEGTSPGLVIILAAAVVAWLAVVLGSTGGRRPFAPLLILVNASWFLSLIYGVLRFGSEMSVRGDSWGVRINVAAIGPLLFGALVLLSIWWWWTRRNLSRTAAPVSLSRLAYLMMGVALILTPVIILLFAAGDGVHHTGKDRLAVVCVIAQCLLVGAALRGYDRTAISDRVGAV